MSSDVASAAFQRLVDALDAARDPARLRAAVTDDVGLERCAPGARGVAPVVESFTGVAEVERWFARMPPGVRFSLAAAVWRDGGGGGDTGGGDAGDGWGVEYAYDAGDFHHGGLWIARLACDGRIAHLSHHPFALREPPGDAHAHGGAGHTHGG